MMRFRDKVAIVTGAASGIGLATAKRLGSEGARVVIADLKGDVAEKSAESVRQAGAPDALGMACDVSEGGNLFARSNERQRPAVIEASWTSMGDGCEHHGPLRWRDRSRSHREDAG
jgi:NAD(P)-dependent dehydrogenase (short-subunit alcohol dehydrogenase family)